MSLENNVKNSKHVAGFCLSSIEELLFFPKGKLETPALVFKKKQTNKNNKRGQVKPGNVVSLLRRKVSIIKSN